MTKRYKSNSGYSTTVCLSSGEQRHIKFLPFSYGGSIYITSNEDEQKALESKPSFNKLFFIESVTGVEDEKKEEPAEETPVVETKQVTVNDLDEAKDYLADNFGIQRSKIRSKVSILATANEHGIEFVGI